MGNRNRIVARIAALTPAKPPPPSVPKRPARRVTKTVIRRVLRKTGRAATRKRAIAVSDVPVDTSLPQLQALTPLPLDVVTALKALARLEAYVEIGQSISNTPSVLASWFPDVITIEPFDNDVGATQQRMGAPHITCLHGSLSGVLANVLQNIRGPGLFCVNTVPDSADLIQQIARSDQRHVTLNFQYADVGTPGRLVFAYQTAFLSVPPTPRIAAWFNTFFASIPGNSILRF